MSDEQNEAVTNELPFLSTIGFMLTYKCTIACPHCVVEAGPHRTEEMSLDQAYSWIEQVSRYKNGGIRAIALTGGEPFYNTSLLSRIAKHAVAHGLMVSVVSNAFWAETPEQAIETLRAQPDITMLSISTDVHHQKFIPFSNITNAVEAARALGRQYNIAVVTDSETDPAYLQIVEQCKSIGEGDRIRLSITFPVGRARHKAKSFNYIFDNEPTIAACTMAGSPIVFPDGKVIACIGPVLTLHTKHPLVLGNLNDEPLESILARANLNPVIHAVRVWGPHKLVSFLRENGYNDLLPQTYITNCICDICYKLFSDEKIIRTIEEILNREENRQLIAYARLYYLKEVDMLDEERVALETDV